MMRNPLKKLSIICLVCVLSIPIILEYQKNDSNDYKISFIGSVGKNLKVTPFVPASPPVDYDGAKKEITSGFKSDESDADEPLVVEEPVEIDEPEIVDEPVKEEEKTNTVVVIRN